ncbi:MAG: hypothetical protein KDB07_09870, partial [Planctomycetes bacterium]|nr:hypothetical protein [Planctomycetota bacterium]
SADAKLVAEACVDAHALLLKAFEVPALRAQLKPLPYKSVAYHQPCHSKVSKVGDMPNRLVGLIPEAKVADLAAGCCGLSGTFGMKTDNFEMSIKIGAKLFNRINQVNPELVFTPCGVCQTQIHQGNPERTVMHPLRMLYDALP